MFICKKKKFLSLVIILSLLVPIFSSNGVVVAASKKPSLNVISMNLLIGHTYGFKVKNSPDMAQYTWSTSNKKIATINNKGIIKGIKKGKVIITCRIKTKTKIYRLKSKVTIIKPAQKITINNPVKILYVGDKYDLNTTITPKSSNDKVTWTSSNKSIANPNNVGKVTALKNGNVTITATTLSGKKDKVTIKVKEVKVRNTQAPDSTTKPSTSIPISESDTSIEDLQEYLNEFGYDSIVQADYDDLEIGYTRNDNEYSVTQNIELITSGTFTSKIKWNSSDTNIITTSGVVTRPDGENKMVTLTATITDGVTSKIKEFYVKIMKKHVPTEVPMTTIDEFKKLNDGSFPMMYSADGGKTVNEIEGTFTSFRVLSLDDAIDSVNSIAKLLGVNYGTDSFEADKVDVVGESVIYRLKQMYKGIPVYANELLIETDVSGKTLSLESTFKRGLNLDVVPKILEKDAGNKALGLHKDVSEIGNIELYIIEDLDEYKLAWMIMLGSENDEYEGECYNVIIDAKNGEVISDESDEMDSSPTVLEGENVNGFTVKVKGTKYSGMIERNIQGHSKYEMYDSQRKIVIYDAEDKASTRNKIVSSATSTINNKSAMSAADNFTHTYDYYKNVLKRKSINGSGKKIKVYINSAEYDSDTHKWKVWSNACWSPGKKVFKIGSAGNGKYAGGLDTLGHEFTHGVMYYKVNFDYSVMSRAINEAYADIMGTMIEAHYSDSDYNMWAFGEHHVNNPSGERNLKNPYLTKNPEKYGEGPYWYDDKNEPNKDYYYSKFTHDNSTVISHAAYLMYDEIGSNPDRLAKLWYGSMSYLHRKNDNFYGVRDAVVKTARALNYTKKEINAIIKAFNDCGMGERVKAFSINESAISAMYENETTTVSYFIKGSIYDAYLDIENDEAEISNAVVSLTDTNGNVISNVTTDENGEYSFDAVLVGKYNLVVSANGYISYTTNIEIIDSNQALDIFLDPIGTSVLSGELTIADTDMDRTNDLPLSGANIKVEKVNGSNKFIKEIISDDEGNYTFDELYAGLYKITISKDGYITSTQHLKIDKNCSNKYNAVIEVISTKYEGKGYASGKIYDLTYGIGIGGLTLKVRSGLNITSGDVIEQYITDEYGGYHTSELPAGNYCIEVIDERILEDEEERYITNSFNIKVLGNYSIDNQNGVVENKINDDTSGLKLLICMETSSGMNETAYRKQEKAIIKVANNMSDFDMAYLCIYAKDQFTLPTEPLTKSELIKLVQEATEDEISKSSQGEADIDNALRRVSGIVCGDYGEEDLIKGISQVLFFSSGLITPIASGFQYGYIESITESGAKFNILKIGEWDDNGYLEYLTMLDYNLGSYYDVTSVDELSVNVFFDQKDNSEADNNLIIDDNCLELTYYVNSKLKAFSSITAKNYTIDWGDGTVTSNNMLHTYDSAGTYTIKVQFTDLEKLSFAYREKLCAVDGQLNGLSKKFNSAKSMFYRCTSLKSVSSELFSDCTEVNDFSNCFGYTQLSTIPDTLFGNCTNATDFSGCFSNTNICAIPETLFSNCLSVIDFSNCFESCNLTEIPIGLFSNCNEVITFANCFRNNYKITVIPENLFSNCTEVQSFSGCFSNIRGIRTIPEKLFVNNTKVTDFSYCFENCHSWNKNEGLIKIPVNLFANNTEVINFNHCFASCCNLASIPEELFANCTKAENFSFCFYCCEEIWSLSDKLFTNCINATSFSSCFKYCESLRYVPKSLFDNCLNVGDFSYCFYLCSSMTNSVPQLWNRTNITNSDGCFSCCYKVSNYSDIPIEWQ